MRALTISAAFAVVALSVACGGSEPPPATPANTTAAPTSDKAAFAGAETKGEAPATGHGDGKGPNDEHGKMPPALHDFHEVLAPVWHTSAGADRIAKTCSGEKTLREKAVAVADAELTADAEAVKAACEKAGKTDVESKLSTLHDRFHKLIEASKK